MELNFSILTNAEVKTRRFWRRVFFILVPLIFFINLLTSDPRKDPSQDMPERLGAAGAEGIIYILLPAFIFYYFAYKKAGTFLLTLYVYIMPIVFLIKGIVLLIYLPFPWNVGLFGLISLIFTFFYRLNWKLRKINKKLQFYVICPEDYILEAETFSKAVSRDDLETFYNSCVQRWPQFEKYSTHLYRQHLNSKKKIGEGT